jgi:F420-dependent oxidoreductase-like protein
MKISSHLSYAGGFQQGVDDVVEMEKAGLDLVWVAEAYGFDSPSLMGYLSARTTSVEIAAGILPLYTRTPALIAMTAAGLDELSRGRFHLGLGASGPQVIEGFHGVPYTAPLGRTREIIEVCRKVWRREEPLEYHGRYYEIPLPKEVGTGLGKPLKILAHPVRSSIPTWIAAIGERNVALAAEIGDGWLPFFFIPERAKKVFGTSLAKGADQRDSSLGPLMINAGGMLALGDDDDTLKLRDRQRSLIALYVGGMGARGKNFYNELAQRYGFEREAKKIQDLYLDGKKAEAEAAVPDELLELTTLCGSEGYVRDRIAAFREAGVTHLQVNPVVQGFQSKAWMIDRVRALAS